MAKLRDKAVGSSVYLDVNGTRTEFLIVHKGLPSADYDESCNGTWLLMKDIHILKAYDATNNSYADSDAHTYLNSEFISLLDSEIQSALTAAKIPYNKGVANTSNKANVMIGENGLSAKAFLLSAIEANITQSYTPVLGATLSYFNGASSAERKAMYQGEAKGWLLRSPYNSDSNGKRHLFVQYTGSVSTVACTTATHGYRPAMIFNDSFEVDANNNVVAGNKSFGGFVKIGSEYRELSSGYVKIGSEYREMTESFKRIGGEYK